MTSTRSQLSPAACALIGVALLAVAQFLAMGLSRMRPGVAAGEAFQAVEPGEFAGTLLLGGFRGLAADLLWLRAVRAKEQGRFYESVALFETISRIQPRFEQVWEYMAWDMAYNIAAEIDDHEGKWSWYLAGLRASVRGVERNPGAERLLRHLAWMFHHKGDNFHDDVIGSAWATLLNPVIAQVNRRIAPDAQLPMLPSGPGLTNFQISQRLYRACVLLAEAEHASLPAYVRRMIPLAIERDGNIFRNKGQHLLALRRYLDSLEAWQEVAAWNGEPPLDEDDLENKRNSAESFETNEGRLRGKAAFLCEQMALDKDVGAAASAALMNRRFAEARAAIEQDRLWRQSLAHGHIAWLDE